MYFITKFKRVSLGTILFYLASRAHSVDWNPLLEQDFNALLDFQKSVDSDPSGLLETWKNTSHPCDWMFVICSCPTFNIVNDCGERSEGFERVYGLNVGPPLRDFSKQISGTLPNSLGNLTRMQILFVGQNRFKGTLPSELGQLPLTNLALMDNQFTGTVPKELGNILSLKWLFMQSNEFEGAMPAELCNLVNYPAASLSIFKLSSNAGLCGPVPFCLLNTSGQLQFDLAEDAINGFSTNTCLQDVDSEGGMCDPTPPFCGAEGGACLHTPNITNRLDGFQFTFDEFLDLESDIEYYMWYLGSLDSPKSVHISAPILVNSTAGDFPLYSIDFHLKDLVFSNGHRYYLTLEAHNGACPGLVAIERSEGILVDNTPPEPVRAHGMDHVFANEDCNPLTTNQKETSEIHACWEAFQEPESAISHYTVQLAQPVEEYDFDLADPSSWEEDIINFGSLYFLDSDITCTRTNQNEVSEICKASMLNITLEPSRRYLIIVCGFNIVGDSECASSGLLTINASSNFRDIIIIVSVVPALVFLIVVGVLAYVYFMWKKMMKRIHEEEQKKREQEHLQHIFNEAVDNAFSVPSSLTNKNIVFDLPEVVFVFTDLESSTQMSFADSETFKQVQRVHDSIIRTQLVRHNGYEMNTQGDSFEMVLPSVEAAVRLCVGVQVSLASTRWSEEVRKRLPVCNQEICKHQPFCGPKVRMGIHLAVAGSFTMEVHSITRHTQFKGVGVSVAVEISDCAYGGQIVMTEPSFKSLGRNSSMGVGLKLATGTALLTHLGRFHFPSTKTSMEMFQVLPPENNQLPYQIQMPPTLRDCSQLSLGKGLEVIHLCSPALSNFTCLVLLSAPPNLGESDDDAFMKVLLSTLQLFNGIRVGTSHATLLSFMFEQTTSAVRFCMVAQVSLMSVHWNVDESSPEFSMNTVLNDDGTHVFKGPRIPMLIHSSSTFTCSQGSHINQMQSFRDISVQIEDSDVDSENLEGSFENPGRSERPAGGSARACLEGSRPKLSMDLSWPADTTQPASAGELAPVIGRTVSEGKRKKSRAAKTNFSVQTRFGRTRWKLTPDNESRLATSLIQHVHAGQTVLTEEAWQEVQGQCPASTQVLALGRYEFSFSDRAQTLVELVPQCIAGRVFQSLVWPLGQTPPACLVPGYRKAPVIEEDLAILFCQVQACPKPEEVPEELRPSLEKVYSRGVELWAGCVRTALREHDGYLCKEPVPGKMTLAFQDVRRALSFAASIQVRLLQVSWEENLLALPLFRPVHVSEETGEISNEGESSNTPSPSKRALVWRGLNARIGVAWGRATTREPLQSTGHADYYGLLPNTAARIMATAYPGQVLLDGMHIKSLLGSDFAEKPIIKLDEDVISVISAPDQDLFRSKKSRNSLTFRSKRRFDANSSQVQLRLANLKIGTTCMLDGLVCGPVRLTYLGLSGQKGIDRPVPLIQVCLPEIEMREFEEPKNLIPRSKLTTVGSFCVVTENLSHESVRISST
mmetsp:Transcript_37667/g.52321  ORF Transcript_37667/g.52321 Transcript_37667/m.52321 type:complete len:1487 (+) Transcript_37667:259-4719(+)|eukprot:CAMPEP_0196571848 /NCGR_PEP_ID=MMETSP1081-20130531/1981_1 /TAXON_ID=36882 /ORGANISM="Pyramimonas amylifera, Strain CCMP720" /LENGTH=1486 /DNA_ID=CAMNT_0041888957 /DNA_START=259 /DNA_END=4719 /DNA_ORIENTATION=+